MADREEKLENARKKYEAMKKKKLQEKKVVVKGEDVGPVDVEESAEEKLTNQVASLTRQLAIAQSALKEKAAAPIEDDKRQLEAMDMELSILRSGMSEKTEEVARLKEELDKAKKEQQQQQPDTETVQKEADDSKKINETLRTELDSITARLTTLQTQYSQLSIRHQESQARVGGLQSENQKLFARLEDKGDTELSNERIHILEVQLAEERSRHKRPSVSIEKSAHIAYRIDLVPLQGCGLCQGELIQV